MKLIEKNRKYVTKQQKLNFGPICPYKDIWPQTPENDFFFKKFDFFRNTFKFQF